MRVCGLVKGVVRGTLAVVLAPLFDWVYPPPSHGKERSEPLAGCPDKADCRAFTCAGYCSEAGEPYGTVQLW